MISQNMRGQTSYSIIIPYQRLIIALIHQCLVAQLMVKRHRNPPVPNVSIKCHRQKCKSSAISARQSRRHVFSACRVAGVSSLLYDNQVYICEAQIHYSPTAHRSLFIRISKTNNLQFSTISIIIGSLQVEVTKKVLYNQFFLYSNFKIHVSKNMLLKYIQLFVVFVKKIEFRTIGLKYLLLLLNWRIPSGTNVIL